MRSTYQEYPASPNLAAIVECFWAGKALEDFSAPIVPDGCADILFYFRDEELIDERIVGVMTRAHVVRLAAGTSIFGLRFQPGMAGACLPCDVPTLNDRFAPLRSVFGSAANELVRAVKNCSSVESRIEALEDWLTLTPTINPVQRAIGELVGRKGQLSLEDFSMVAGVSERQLRRTCLKHSGLSPKKLARILRLRNAITCLHKTSKNQSDMAKLALDCGYYDQPHMIREFRELVGISPMRYLRHEVR